MIKEIAIIILSLLCFYRFIRKRNKTDLCMAVFMGLILLSISPYRHLIFHNFASILLSYAIVISGVITIIIWTKEFIKDLKGG